MRLDKLIWFLRLAPSRTLAHDWIESGHFRLNGRRVERPATSVKPGDVLVLPLRQRVRVIKLLALPNRRGSANETIACYRTLDAGSDFLIAPRNTAATHTGAAEGNLHS